MSARVVVKTTTKCMVCLKSMPKRRSFTFHAHTACLKGTKRVVTIHGLALDMLGQIRVVRDVRGGERDKFGALPSVSREWLDEAWPNTARGRRAAEQHVAELNRAEALRVRS